MSSGNILGIFAGGLLAYAGIRLIGDMIDDMNRNDEPTKTKLEKGIDAYNVGNYESAYQIFTQLAESGDADGQYWLGKLYLKTEKGQQDIISAYVWTVIAARNDSLDAKAALNEIEKQLDEKELEEANKKAERLLKNNYKDYN